MRDMAMMKKRENMNQNIRKPGKGTAAVCMGLGLLTLVMCLAVTGPQKVFGSMVDWISQHSVIADYFRQQFYETGQIFPEFAANIGGGQNIYNFAYYGLYSPVILLSYLLPFVKMGDYLIAASIAGLGLAVILMYCWLLSRGVSQTVSLWTAVLFLLAGPMIFHSYSQVMFVNYMPFLGMALIGVDRYFEQKKTLLFTAGVFLMIMTSFYFSICGMLVLVLYGLHRYFQVESEQGNKVTAGKFLKDGICFALPMLTAVLMSGILLVPTALALTGRSSAKGTFSLLFLLCPDVKIMRFVYTPYGIGLTTFVITVLITGLTYKRCYERVLFYGSVLILTVPLFACLLNGGLYIRDKVLIPFLPLLCYMTAYYLEKLKRGETAFLRGFAPYLITLVLICLMHGDYPKYWTLLLLDGSVMAVCFALYYWKKKILFLQAPPLVFLLAFAVLFHTSADRMAGRDFYDKVTDQAVGDAMAKVLEKETGFYRMEQTGIRSENSANLNRVQNMGQYISSIYSSSYNAEYQDFRQNIFGVEEPYRNFLMQSVSKNPLFQRFMGVKYLVLDETDGDSSEAYAKMEENIRAAGYELYETDGNIKIYRNEDVSPIAYATDRLISSKEYEKLAFPYNQTALLSCAVVENGMEAAEDSAEDVRAVPAELKLPTQADGAAIIEKSEDGYHIRLQKSCKVHAGIETTEEDEKAAGLSENRVLFLQFRMKNNKPSKDVSVYVEQEQNKLSANSHIYYNKNTVFTYAVALQPGQDEVEIIFGAGDYEIADIQCFSGSDLQAAGPEAENRLYQSEFFPDKENTKGNRITGTISVENEGYFITTIPYDKNFEIKVDGENVTPEKVNTAFLGFPVDKGEHEIEMIYHAPGLAAGKILSLVGLLLLLINVLKRNVIFN